MELPIRLRTRGRCAALILLLSLRSVADAPAQTAPWNSEAWWTGAGLLLGGALLLDGEIRSTLPEGGGERLQPLANPLNYLGNPRYLVPVIGAAWVTGKLARAPELSSSAAHVAVGLLAGGIANGTVKYVVGRERPAGGDPHAFRPFNSENRWQSFPSGHTVVAFSLAAAVSEEAGRPWVTGLTYGAASLVGWSRVYEDKHWTSDVVGGALIGIASSRTAVALLHRRRPHQKPECAASLLLHPGELGVSLPTC